MDSSYSGSILYRQPEDHYAGSLETFLHTEEGLQSTILLTFVVLYVATELYVPRGMDDILCVSRKRDDPDTFLYAVQDPKEGVLSNICERSVSECQEHFFESEKLSLQIADIWRYEGGQENAQILPFQVIGTLSEGLLCLEEGSQFTIQITVFSLKVARKLYVPRGVATTITLHCVVQDSVKNGLSSVCIRSVDFEKFLLNDAKCKSEEPLQKIADIWRNEGDREMAQTLRFQVIRTRLDDPLCLEEGSQFTIQFTVFSLNVVKKLYVSRGVTTPKTLHCLFKIQ